MGTKDPRVDAYIERSQPFAKPILKFIRKTVHAGCPEVSETIKWGVPHFDYKGPLCGMAAFKEHIRFGFWKSQLLGPAASSEGDGMAQYGSVKSVDDLPGEKELGVLVRKAASLNDQGVKVQRVRTAKAPVEIPAYFQAALKKHRKTLTNFESLSPSHKREYIEWITEAKQDATRERRMATALEWIAEGKSRNWKYER